MSTVENVREEFFQHLKAEYEIHLAGKNTPGAEQAAQIIQQAADPEAEILFGCVHDEKMAGNVKVTVIATGFDRLERDLAEIDAAEEPKPMTVGSKPLRPPFMRGDDSGGFGPNASSRDDFDIPTVLRRQMD